MLARYVWRDLVRNPRRTLATLIGVILGVGLFSAVLFFIDGSSASMTQRAVAPLPIDMQRVLTTPIGEGLALTQRIDPGGRIEPGQRARVILSLVNRETVPANEVVLRSEPPPGLTYLPGSATVDGGAVDDVGGGSPFAQGAAKTGRNLGTILPGQTLVATYRVEATTGVDTNATAFRSSFSSREIVIPVEANAPPPVGLDELATRIADIDGVAYAERLSFVDLPPGSLSAGPTVAPGPVRLFAFARSYRQRYDDIELVRGTDAPGEALISVEAARALQVGIGDTIALALPGSEQRFELGVGGIVDLSKARALFFSRHGSNLEDFLYSPNSVVIDPVTFASEIMPAYEDARATLGAGLKSVPILEVDVGVERERLDADPTTALDQTSRIAAAVMDIAADQDYLIDNITNTLGVAREDAIVAKRMFVFLGVPGALLAAILAAYAGSVLAWAQRREQATLRIRGADRRHLLRMLATRTLLLTAVGATLGVALGLVSAAVVVGWGSLMRASTAELVASGIVGAIGGSIATGAALYAAGRSAIGRDINDDRSRLGSRAPLWRRAWLDLAGLVAVAAIAVLAVRADAFAGTPGSVYEGRGVELKLLLLVLPIGIWIAGALALARLLTRGARHLSDGSRRPFSHPVRSLFVRSVRRRSWATAEGAIVIGLIVGLGTSVASFTASYDAAKAADARFFLGSDIRVTPSPTSPRPPDVGYASTLLSANIAEATPVVFSIHNTVLRSDHNEDAASLAAIDPATFPSVAAVEDSDFVDMTSQEAFDLLASDPTAALLSVEMAEFLTLEVGDPVQVLFGMGGKHPIVVPMRVAGLFQRLPAFPEGAQAVIDIAQMQQHSPTVPDFFLARAVDPGDATLAAAVGGIDGASGERLTISSRQTALDKDQSSLAALNIRGLLTLDSSYALAMGVVAISIFVFGLLLQRRREYVTMRAQGLHAREIRRLIVAEAGAVAICGCAIGVIVGIAMAAFFVGVLRPLFILTPQLRIPGGSILTLTSLVMVATIVTSIAATSLVNRLRPTELLRDE